MLFGCRGTGKSTWLRNEFSHAHYISLLDESIYQAYLADDSLFYAELRGVPRGSWIVVDEIQRLPQLLNAVHLAIENYQHKFVLSGSSARKLKRFGVNLFGGRALSRLLFPFHPLELGGDFVLEKALHVGTLPVIWESENPQEQIVGYSQCISRKKFKVRHLCAICRGFLGLCQLRHSRNDWFRGLHVIEDIKGIQRKILVYPAGRYLKIDAGIELMPFQQFCEEIGTERLWP